MVLLARSRAICFPVMPKWKPSGYQSLASTTDEDRAGRVCHCEACERDGQHSMYCGVHREPDPLPCDCPRRAGATSETQ